MSEDKTSPDKVAETLRQAFAPQAQESIATELEFGEGAGRKFEQDVIPNNDVFSTTAISALFRGPTPQTIFLGKLGYDELFDHSAVKPLIDTRKMALEQLQDYKARMPGGVINSLKKFSAGAIAFATDPINLAALSVTHKIIGTASAPLATHLLEKNFVEQAVKKSLQSGGEFALAALPQGLVNESLAYSAFHDDYNSLQLLHDVGTNALMGMTIGLGGHLLGTGIERFISRKGRVAENIPDLTKVHAPTELPPSLQDELKQPITVQAFTPESMQSALEMADAQSSSGNKIDVSLTLQKGFNDARTSLENPDPPIEKIDDMENYLQKLGTNLDSEIKLQRKLVDDAWKRIPTEEKVINPYDISKMVSESAALKRAEQTLPEVFFNNKFFRNVLPKHIQLGAQLLKETEFKTLEKRESFLGNLKNFNEQPLLENGIKEAIEKENAPLLKELRNRKEIVNAAIEEGSLTPHTKKSPVASEVKDTQDIVRHASTFETMELQDELSKMREAKALLSDEILKTRSARDIIQSRPKPLDPAELLQTAQNNINGMNSSALRPYDESIEQELKRLPDADSKEIPRALQQEYDTLELTDDEKQEAEKIEAKRAQLPKWKETYNKLIDCFLS